MNNFEQKGKFFNKFFYPDKSLYIFEATYEVDDINEEEYKTEILENVKLIKKFQPKYYLYDASKPRYQVVAPEMQKWLYENSLKITSEIIEKEAIVINDVLLVQVSVKQVLEEEKAEKVKRKMFTNKEEAIKWLLEK
jgi:hypothetical protein